MARFTRPQVILPALLSVAILVGLLAFGNIGAVWTRIREFDLRYLVYFVLLTVCYEALRCYEWHFLLGRLGLRVPVRTQIFTFFTGEITKDLPVGNFVPDYVLQRSHAADFGLASSATLLITLLEVALCLTGVVIIGIDGWTWLRPVILIGTFLAALVFWTFYRWHHLPHKHRPHPHLMWLLRWKAMQVAVTELRQFVRGEAALLHPDVLATGVGIASAYLVLGGLGLYVTAAGLRLDQLDWWEALAAYFFSIAFAAIVPLPMDFGSVELSGTGALIAMGITGTAAVSVELLNRVLSFGTTVIIAGIVLILLRDQLKLTTQPEPAADGSTATPRASVE